MITQKQLQALAEWNWGDKITDMVLPSECSHILIELNGTDPIYRFDPFEDANQREMLRDKMIEDANIKEYIIKRYSSKKCGAYYHNWIQERYILKGWGKTIAEAELNCLIKYVEGLK